MSVAHVTDAAEQAVVERVRIVLAKAPATPLTVAVRSPERPAWTGPPTREVDGYRVTVTPCSSLLSVLDALTTRDPSPGAVLVILTQLGEPELGDGVLARVHEGKVLQADRHTLLDGLLRTRAQDPRLRREPWLVDALIDLARAGALPATAGTTLTRSRALASITSARLGVDPEDSDLPGLVLAFDDVTVRTRWRALAAPERAGLTEYLGQRHGRAAEALVHLTEDRDDVLADLLAGQAIARAGTVGDVAWGGFAQSRFPRGRPARDVLAQLGDAAATAARDSSTARVHQQVARGDAVLDELDARSLAVGSAVLRRGYDERLARAATSMTDDVLDEAARHQRAEHEPERLERLRAALRLRRWVAGEPATEVADIADGLRRHAAELAWVDRALAAVRAGDPDPRIRPVLAEAAASAGTLRDRLDQNFAARLAAAPGTPETLLAVETVLPRVVGPVAETQRVLLVVVDGMSGAVAGDLADELTDPRQGWTEVVRNPSGQRETVLAALPSETDYSRTSLLCGTLRPGTHADEKKVFPALACWRNRRAVLVHKAGLAGTDGSDLGEELESALDGADGAHVVGVVLNAVDDALTKGRQSVEARWRPGDIPGLPALLGRAAESGRVVVLVSDHGHVLEHGSELRSDPSGKARWRAPGSPATSDEVSIAGPRVLVPSGEAVFAATENVRYGKREHGYHGGATLAEMAIPLVVLLPPGQDAFPGWTARSAPPPAWWSGHPAREQPTGRQEAAAEPAPAPKRRRAPAATQVETLFDAATPPAPEPPRGPGATLIDSAAFRSAHQEVPANRRPDAGSFAAVVDALVDAGGRLPLAAVAQRAGGAGRNPRGVFAALSRVLNREGYPVLTLVDGGRAVVLDEGLLDEQFPSETP